MRIVISCPPVPGHLNPSLTLAAELKCRGHDVRLAAFIDAESKAQGAGIRLHAVGELDYPRGKVFELMRELGALSGFAASRFTLQLLQKENLTYLRDLPGVCEREGIEGLVLDQVAYGAASVAQALRLPYVTISNALWLSRDTSSPPWSASWPHGSGFTNRLGNWFAHVPLRLVLANIFKPINSRRHSLGLGPLTYRDWGESPLAVVAQQPQGFEFPEVRVPDHVHFTGPFHRVETREHEPFPYELLDSRPLIYTSMGTIQNRLAKVFHTIAGACEGLDAQLVMTSGVKGAVLPHDLPGNPLLVDFAPQLELLRRASVVITHAGLNTALECLAQGVPMVAIPITNDQPGIAARLKLLRSAEVVPLKQMNEQRLRAAVEKVLVSGDYRQAARRMQFKLAAGKGLQRAAEIVEEALITQQSPRRIDVAFGKSRSGPVL